MKVTKTMGLVIGVYLGTWLPIIIIAPMARDDSPATVQWLDTAATWLWLCNAFINPIIYAFRFSDFKRAFNKLLYCTQ